MTLRLREDAVSWAATDEDTIVVLDLRTSKYLSLNASGSLLWQRLAVGASEAELRAALVETFALDAERAATDVDAFLVTLRSRDLILEA